MDKFRVFLFSLPKVTEDNESILPPPAQTKEFSDRQEAEAFALTNKTEWERVMVIREAAGKRSLVSRCCDGECLAVETG